MKIIAQQKKMLSSSSELLSLSRSMRQLSDEVGNVEQALRTLSELDACRYELKRQRDAMDLLTGRVVNLSTSLREIAELYTKAEERNEYNLEEAKALRRGATGGGLFTGREVNKKILKILGK